LIKPDDLTTGDYYFLLLFYHPKYEIPMIKTFIYVGKNLYYEGTHKEDEFYFQDPRSYLEHGSFDAFDTEIEHETFFANHDVLLQMYDIHGLIERLAKIAK
jgi:predicted RNA-binding protein with PUA-like domain